MTATSSSSTRIIRFPTNDSQTLVYQDGEHTCARSWSDVVRACRMLDESSERSLQLRDLLEYLHAWVRDHERECEYAYLVVRAELVTFIVVQRHAEFDPALASALSMLELDVLENGQVDMLRFSSLALPKCSDEDVLQFLGDAHPAHA